MPTEKLVTEGGVITMASLIGGAIATDPALGVLVTGGLAFLGVLARCLVEVWKIKRRDREKIATFKARLERNNLSTAADTEE